MIREHFVENCILTTSDPGSFSFQLQIRLVWNTFNSDDIIETSVVKSTIAIRFIAINNPFFETSVNKVIALMLACNYPELYENIKMVRHENGIDVGIIGIVVT